MFDTKESLAINTKSLAESMFIIIEVAAIHQRAVSYEMIKMNMYENHTLIIRLVHCSGMIL